MKTVFQKKKLIVWLGFAFLLFFIATTALMSLTQRHLLIESHKESLQMLAGEKAAQVDMYMNTQKEKYEILSSMNAFKQAALYPNDPAIIAEADKRINELKQYFPGIGVISKEGIIIVSENNPAGTDYSSMPQFPANDKSAMSFMRYYDQFRKKDYFGVFGPIYDRADTSKVIGMIGYDIELDKISTLMKETLDSKTNEVYLIDETGILLSGSKYIGKGNKNGILIQEVKSDGAKACLADLKKYKKDGTIEDHEEAVFQYINYMGDEVFGAHAYVPSIMGCVIAEEGKGEILGVSMGEYIKNMFQKKEADYEN